MQALLFSFLLILSPSLFAQEDILFAYVTLKTSEGDIKMKLYKKDAPRTVENFIQLATGKITYRSVVTGQKIKDTPFYKDMIFHRVHPELGIHTGCPWGNGKGWPGYTIKDEKNELKFDRPYLVGMAQIPGTPNTVGSQFFITTVAAPHLNKDYNVMGEVIKGQHLVQKISLKKRDAMMRPIEPVKLIEVIVDSE